MALAARCELLLKRGRLIVIGDIHLMEMGEDVVSSELKSFGLAIRLLREKAQLSQEALGHISGLHRTYIGSVERGERNVSLLNIHALAGALNLPASELMRAAEALSNPTSRFQE